MMAVGVARPSAQGQAMTSTETAVRMAASRSPPMAHQPMKVTAAMTSTTGTKTALTLSTSALDRRLGRLRPFDHADDPRQHGLVADGQGLDRQQAVAR